MVLIILAFLLPHSHIIAQWTNDPMVNTPVCTTPGGKEALSIVPDGSGGVIILFMTGHPEYDLYAQRLDANGFIRWQPSGIPISVAEGLQASGTAISDGDGGAIIAWLDNLYVGGFPDTALIHVQRIDSSGNLVWGSQGISIFKAKAGLVGVDVILMTSDGAHGTIVVWGDTRNGNYAPFAQHVDANGTLTWTENGVLLCDSTVNQLPRKIISDGNGGAIVLGSIVQCNVSCDYDVFLQHVNSSGKSTWTPQGIPVDTSIVRIKTPGGIVSDDNGGAIVFWSRYEAGAVSPIFTQRIDANGGFLWGAGSVQISTTSWQEIKSVADGEGGAIVTWYDYDTLGNGRYYTQRINSAGNIDWKIDLVDIGNVQSAFDAVPDGSGGVYLTWDEVTADADGDIYVQQVSHSGSKRWQGHGAPVTTAPGSSGVASLSVHWKWRCGRHMGCRCS